MVLKAVGPVQQLAKQTTTNRSASYLSIPTGLTARLLLPVGPDVHVSPASQVSILAECCNCCAWGLQRDTKSGIGYLIEVNIVGQLQRHFASVVCHVIDGVAGDWQGV